MKKVLTLLFALSLFLLVGCSNETENKTTPTLKEGSYYDKNNMHNDSSLEWIYLKENNVVERTVCGADAGCSLFKGSYEIKETILEINLTQYSDEIDGWTDLDENEKIKYTITKDNEFNKDESVFILDTKK